jgi:hypothetical protein
MLWRHRYAKHVLRPRQVEPRIARPPGRCRKIGGGDRNDVSTAARRRAINPFATVLANPRQPVSRAQTRLSRPPFTHEQVAQVRQVGNTMLVIALAITLAVISPVWSTDPRLDQPNGSTTSRGNLNMSSLNPSRLSATSSLSSCFLSKADAGSPAVFVNKDDPRHFEGLLDLPYRLL